MNTSRSNSALSVSAHSKSILRVKSLSESIGSVHSNISSSSSTSSSSSNSVQFDKVEIREYSITLGDNPACSSGPPISLGWLYSNEELCLPLEHYEQHRDGQRRVIHEMKVPSHMRHEMLRAWNISTSDMIRVQSECQAVQKQRSRTAQKFQTYGKSGNFAQRIKKIKKNISSCINKQKRTQ